MSKIRNIDKLQKGINSVVFRIILIFYSLVIISFSDNFFPDYLYIVYCLIYLIFYILIIKRSYFRLINDLVLFFLIMFNKDPLNIVNYCFLLLYIVNRLNFTGRVNRYNFIAVIPVLIPFLYNYYIFYGINLNILLYVFPFVIFYFLTYLTLTKYKIRYFLEEINSKVDDYYLNIDRFVKPYSIYSEISLIINSKVDLIDKIFCVTFNKIGEPIIVNSSDFIFDLNLNDFKLNDFHTNNNILQNKSISIDGIIYNNNISYLIPCEELNYVYIFILKRNLPFYLEIITAHEFIKPSLFRISKILLTEKHLNDIKAKELRSLSKKRVNYIRSIKTMHFVRNRLTAFKNLTELVSHYNNNKNPEVYDLLIDQNAKSKLEIELITKRAEIMLEKSNDPFDFSECEEILIKDLYLLVKSNTDMFFGTDALNTNLNEEFLNLNNKVLINLDGFSLFLSDWYSNINKYNNGFVKISFNFEKNNNILTLFFENNYKNKEQLVVNLVRDFLSNDRNEILKRKTHGIYIMKDTLNSMNLFYDLIIDKENKVLTFNLQLKLI